MYDDERLEVANRAYFQLIDQMHRQTLVRLRTAGYRHHFVQKIQGLLYLWTAPQRGYFAFAHLLEYPEEEISTICFIPEQTQLQSDQYYQELQLANRFYTAKRQLDEAIRHYRQALAKRTTIECLNNIGCALLESKRLKDAKSHFLSATSLAPRAHEPYHNLAHTQIKMAFSEGLAETELAERTKASIMLYQKSLELNPDNHFAWHNIGNIHAANEDYLQAIKFYLKAVSLSPKYASSLCALAHCYRSIRDYSNAFEALLPLLKQSNSYSFFVTLANLLVESSTVSSLRLNAECVAGFSEYFKNKAYFGMSVRQRLNMVKPLYEQALKIKPSSSSALTGLGNLHMLMGDYELALQCYKKAVYFNSRCIAAHNGAALAFYCMRNYELAEIKFIDSLNISRSKLSTLLGTFVIRLRLKQTAQAVKIAEELSRLYPQNQLIYYYHSLLIRDATSRKEKIKEGLTKKPLFPNNHHHSYKIIGELMLQFGLVEEAAEYFKQAKNESLLSWYHQQLIQPQKAMDAYIKVLQENKNNDEALFKIAEVCFEYGLLEFCEAGLIELLKTDKQNIKFLSLLSRVKSQQKRHGEEIAICQQIVSLTGESEDALNCLALAHLKQGNLFEASRCVRLALKKDPRNWAVLNNLANISRQIDKHEEARHYYRESQQTGPECFVPFINSAGLLSLFEAFPASESTVKTFNLCLHFLFCDQYNPCFREILKLSDKIADQDYFQMVNALNILQLQFPPFVEYGLLIKFLLSCLCNQDPLFNLQRLLNLSESLDGFADAIQSMNYPCDGETLSQILYLMLKQAFAVNQQETLIANHYLCEKYKQFQDYSKRKELIFWAKGQMAVRIEKLFKIIESVLSNQEKQRAQSAIHKQIYAGIKKAKRIRTLIENEQIQISQIEQVVSKAFSLSSAKNGHYYEAFSDILSMIEGEQQKLLNDLKKSSKDQKAKVFIAYYETTYFVNLFIKYSLHSFAHFIDPSLRITLAEAFLKAKCSNRGTIQILKMLMKELSIKESTSSQYISSLLKISQEYEEKKKLSQRSEEEVTPKEKQLKETSCHRQTREESRYSKLSIVFQSIISERCSFLIAQKQPQTDHSALRIKIQFNLDYSSFNLCFYETRQRCKEYLSNHSFLHFDYRQTLMKTENPLDYQQMLELGYQEVFRFIQHLSSAIIQLEEHGIYHCDLSLKNVIRIQDTFKVVDFAFVMMLENKDLHFYESTKKLVGLLIEPKTKQIQETVVGYIFRDSEQAIQGCLFELRNEQLDPEERILSFLARLKDHAIAYNRKLLKDIINGIVNTNQQTPKLFLDEIPIITEYLNQITNQPHQLKKYLETFCQKCSNFMKQNSMLESQ